MTSQQGNISIHAQNIMPIIKRWLYSDKDIFIREMVSNGCDAITKQKMLSPGAEEDWRVTVTLDAEKGELTFSDNGIGMTAEEVEKYINQVAFSGAEEFLKNYEGDEKGGIIGHFGLGFYSAFMVADRVTIETLSGKEGASPVRWTSEDGMAFTMEDGSRTQRGTDVILHISEEEKEFLEEYRVREVLKRYCGFMATPVYFDVVKKEEPAKEGQEGEKAAENKEPKGPELINDTPALWLKAPKDCTDEEYKKFYRDVFHTFDDPLFYVHLNVDYPFNLKGILYFPKLTNDFGPREGEIKLFSGQVFVADNIKEVIPEFLLLLKGVIDCPDMPLNVSRSFLQNDGQVQKIAQHITKKVSDKLHQIFKNDRETYEKYWNDISAFIKFGCLKDEKFYDRMKDILLLHTIDGEYKTLEEYPKADENKIYYVTDENLQAQYISMFRQNGLTAAVLTHVIDPHFISMLEYKEQEKLKFLRIDSDLGSALKTEQTEEEKQQQEEQDKQLIERFKQALPEEKLEYQVESLKSDETPAVILLSEYARRIQDMSRAFGESFGGPAQVTLVLNRENPIIRSLETLPDDKRELVCKQVYDLAQLAHKPLSAEQMQGFMRRSMQLLGMVTGESHQ